jgi:hypothetical protein
VVAPTRRRLAEGDVAAWLVKSSLPPPALVEGWAPGATHRLDRCLRRSYRLGLMQRGQPCLLWLSGSDRPGVHAVGTLAGPPTDDPEPSVPVELRLLERPVARAELLRVPELADTEVLRMPAGSNPSYLTPVQLAAVLELVAPASLRPGVPRSYRGRR